MTHPALRPGSPARARPGRSAPPLAVFDVDETLIRVKSMFRFLHHLLVRTRGAEAGAAEYRRIVQELETLRSLAPREAVNRQFYRAFAGLPLAELERLAHDWFDEESRATPDFFLPASVARLRRHREEGCGIVFLSGSATFILTPVAEALGGGTVLGIELETRDGVVTGEIDGIQTIGEGKAAALTRLAERTGRSLEGCFAYGDHLSDLPFLELATHPHVVAGDPQLERIARQRNWPVLDGTKTERNAP